jgi:hypothetical protein
LSLCFGGKNKTGLFIVCFVKLPPHRWFREIPGSLIHE